MIEKYYNFKQTCSNFKPVKLCNKQVNQPILTLFSNSKPLKTSKNLWFAEMEHCAKNKNNFSE